jgi:hypothetical protein
MTDDKNLTFTMTVPESPRQVFDAICDVRSWWSGDIDGPTDQLGAEFTYRYEDLHRSTQKITESVPGKKIVWHVVDSHLAFVRDKREWTGTDIVFEIASKGAMTELRFTHVGLAPRVECYGRCRSAWGFYIEESLRKRITTGRGEPNEISA